MEVIVMKLFLTGDTHGDDFHRLNSKNFPEGKLLNKEDYVVVLGDFGCPWNNFINNDINTISMEDKWILETFYNKKPWTTLFIPGNHENYNNLNCYPEVHLDPICISGGPKVKKLNDSVYMLQNGFYQFGNKLVYCFGGATSIDKKYRIEDVSWWKQEVPTHEELEMYFTQFINSGKIPNYIFSHTTSSIVTETAILQLGSLGFNIQSKINDPVVKYLDNILEYIKKHDTKNEYLANFCGHFHLEKVYRAYKTYILYRNVIELNLD